MDSMTAATLLPFPALVYGPMVLICAASLAVNIPLGYVREGYRKFSPAWFFYVHLSVPLIAYLRWSNHVTEWAIPAFFACAVLGQVAGGMIRRRRRVRT